MKKIFAFVSLLALLTSACSKDTPTPTDTTSLVVTLSGSTLSPQSTRNVGTPTQTDENVIKHFTVYIYENDILVQSETFTGVTTGAVSNVIAGEKTIVVVANAPTTFPTIDLGTNYTELAATANYIKLEDQETNTNGLVMTGQSTTTIITGSPNQVNIPISRLVAKIILGTVTVDAAAGYDPALFELNGVAIIKGKSESSLGLPSVVTIPPFYSGIAGSTVTGVNVKSFLFESITLADHANRYFYVFSNDDTNGDATIMALSGTYEGVEMYFPFVIDMPAGSFIKPNTSHVINVTLRRLGGGSVDPEIPVVSSTLDVTITPQDWIVEPVQNEEW